MIFKNTLQRFDARSRCWGLLYSFRRFFLYSSFGGVWDVSRIVYHLLIDVLLGRQQFDPILGLSNFLTSGISASALASRVTRSFLTTVGKISSSSPWSPECCLWSVVALRLSTAFKAVGARRVSQISIGLTSHNLSDCLDCITWSGCADLQWKHKKTDPGTHDAWPQILSID